MTGLLVVAASLVFGASAFAGSVPGEVFTVVSTDGDGFRYRAVFSHDVQNEIAGNLVVEKIKMPGAAGGSYGRVWSKPVQFDKIDGLKADYAKLEFESLSVCCRVDGMKWEKNNVLKFQVSVGRKMRSCVTTDVSGGEFSVTCK